MVQIRKTPTAAHPSTFPTLQLSTPYATIICGAVLLLKEYYRNPGYLRIAVSHSIPADKGISFISCTIGNSVSELKYA